MELDAIEFADKIERRHSYLKNISKPLGSVFDGHKLYLNSYNVYLSYHGKIPRKIVLHQSDPNKIIKRIEENYSEKIIEKHYLRYSLKDFGKYCYTHVVFLMCNEIIIEVEMTGEMGILFTENSEEEALVYEGEFVEKRKKARERKINLLSQGQFGLDLVPLVVKKPKMNLDLNYNDDLPELHEFLLKDMGKKNSSGLVLLHGKPGTGKSTYIRYLINCLKKKVIFLPPAIAASLESAHMTSILVENPNAIFVIEDAEQLIKSRESGGNSSISMLLNLTDGILGESLGSLMICTFNTDLKNIDDALLRKGHLIASYKFEELAFKKLALLKDHLGLGDMQLKEGMVLSDLYHATENRFGNSVNKKATIGFQGNF